jgi:hypothetical protein
VPPRTKKPAEKPAEEAPAAQERPKQTAKRITEGEVAEITRLVPAPIKEEDRLKLNLWQKRARVIEEVGTIPKRGYNAHHKYAYALEADMVAYIGPLMAKYNLVVDVSVLTIKNEELGGEVPAVERIELYRTQSGSQMMLTRLPLRITIINGDAPDEKTELIWIGEGADTGDKAVYKSYTGALKYFYMKYFMVATGDDPEAFERVDELAEGAGTRNVKVEKSSEPQPEKGGRQQATTGVQVRSLGAMSRALRLGGEDQTDRVKATAEYIDKILGSSVLAGLGDLEGDEAERAFKQIILGLPGEDVGKVLYQMGEDVKRVAAEAAEDAVAEATNPYGGSGEPEPVDDDKDLPDIPEKKLTEEEAADSSGATQAELDGGNS